MLPRPWLVCLILVFPGSAPIAQAQVPERLLPAGSQLYLRWDGMDPHRAAFQKTAVGQMLQGDMGKFLAALPPYADHLLTFFAEDAGLDEKSLQLIRDIPGTLGAVNKNGFALGLEVNKINPPDVQLMLVFPKGDPNKGIPQFISRSAALGGAKVNVIKSKGRLIHNISEVVHLSWWQEGEDGVVVLGSRPPDAILKNIEEGGLGLTQNPLFQKVRDAKEFPTWGRGYLDTASLVKLGGTVSPESQRLLSDLGLDGLASITFQSGFDGPAERSLVEIHTPGPRKGLLRLGSQKTFTLADLPPLPDDVNGFSASNFDPTTFYDVLVGSVEAGVRVFAPNEVDKVREVIRQGEGILGVKLREDLFGSFGDLAVQYASPSEGPLGLGAVALLKVKDEKKLAQSLETIFKAIPKLPGAEVQLNKKSYHGVEYYRIMLSGEVNVSLPSFAIHKGWLAISSYPQSIHGYILRAKGELPVWKANAELSKGLSQFPKEFVSISVSDPRPSMKAILALLPPAIDLANTLGIQAIRNEFRFGAPRKNTDLRPFDIALLPHPQEVTRHLFPNITVTTDDGKRIRIETRASLSMPF